MTAAIAQRRLAPIFLVTAVAISVWTYPAVAQKSGGSITLGLELDIPVFDTLVSLDDKGETVPRLSLSWSHSDDFKTWTFKLRSGVKFQDGTPFNAQAVKENYD